MRQKTYKQGGGETIPMAKLYHVHRGLPFWRATALLQLYTAAGRVVCAAVKPRQQLHTARHRQPGKKLNTTLTWKCREL